MSVTIIGCGWLGLPLGKALIKKKYEVHGSVRSESGFSPLNEAGIQPFQLDLEKSTTIPPNISASTSVLIITLPPIDRKNPKRFQTMLSDVLQQFPNETRVFFTSSTGIYPKEEGNYVENFDFTDEQESTILNLAEEAIRTAKQAHVIFRLGGLIGPNRHPIRFLQGRKGVKNPDGPINFVHQGDCINALLQSIYDTDVSGTFNLVFPSHPKRKNYYEAAAKFYEIEAPVFQEDDDVQRLISSEKIRTSLGFEFEFPIDVFPQIEFN